MRTAQQTIQDMSEMPDSEESGKTRQKEQRRVARRVRPTWDKQQSNGQATGGLMDPSYRATPLIRSLGAARNHLAAQIVMPNLTRQRTIVVYQDGPHTQPEDQEWQRGAADM